MNNRVNLLVLAALCVAPLRLSAADLVSDGFIYSTNMGATRVGVLNAGGSGPGTTFFGMYYDAANNAGVISALSGGVAWRPLVLNPNGANVGIGTTTPTSTLTVNGTISAKEIKVTASGADYVFEDGYKLRPLDEVAEFVARERHLPDIASAKVMQAEGMLVSEAVTRQLAKIEELTMYVIALHRENRRLAAENVTFERRLKALEAR
jgi:hypothetical protein